MPDNDTIATKMLEKLSKTHRKYKMLIAGNKTVWKQVVTDGGPSRLEATELEIQRISHYKYFGSMIERIENSEPTVETNLLKAKSRLTGLRLVLRTKNLTTEMKTRLAGISIEPNATCRLATIVLRR